MTLRTEEKYDFFKELHSIYLGGLNLSSGLNCLTSNIAKQLRFGLTKGQQLSTGLADLGLEPEILSLLATAEESDSLKLVLPEIVKYYQEMLGMRKELLKKITYPLFNIIFALIVLLFFVLFVQPGFEQKAGINWLNVSELVLILIIFIVPCFLLYKHRYKQFLKRLNFYKNYFRYILLTGFKLSMLMNKDYSKYFYAIGEHCDYQKAVFQCAFSLKRGNLLSVSLLDAGLINRKTGEMIRLAEELSILPIVIAQLAEEYKEKYLQEITTLVGLVEPLAVILCGLIVGLTAMNVILPGVEMMQKLS